MKNKLPNFLIVGAAKSGTSSLHNYLKKHPDIFMPEHKEPYFLIKGLIEHRVRNGIWSWKKYKSLFDDVKKEKLIGESTVFYLYFYNEAIKNIKKYLGEDVKIIIMLRNPADRAYSAFNHVSRGFKEGGSFENALAIEELRMERDNNLTPMVMYKQMGMYYNMVKAYVDSFKHVHIIFYDDFRDNIDFEMQKTYNFLGVKNDLDIDLSIKYNVGGKRWKSELMKYIFMRDYHMKSIIKLILPKRIRSLIYSSLVNVSTNQIKPMKEETRQELNNYFKQDIKQLSVLLSKNLNHWIE
tara:strand:+ start:13311 stop:14198 length:888 start_codon:yes stop_codon:yes gene_type:complete